MELVVLNGVPHWRHEGKTLPVMAGGQTLDRILELRRAGTFNPTQVTSNIDLTGLPPGARQFTVGGETFIELADGTIIRDVGVQPPTPQRFAPPAFSGTQAGLAFQADLQSRLQREGAAQQMDLSRFQESEAFRRVEAQLGTQRAIATFEANESFRRQVLSEIGAGARADISAFTTQRGQSIGAVQDTFARLSDLATQPSDFRRLAFNVEGIQPPGETPTDLLRQRMREFFQQQIGFAGQESESFADVFNRTRQQVGVPAPTKLQFGGKPKSRVSITGEKGPELVFDASRVIPNLSKSEMRALKAGGVGGKQFGGTSSNLFTQEEPFFSSIRRGEPQSFSPAAFNTQGVTASGFRPPSLPSLSQFSSLLPFQQQMLLGSFGEEVNRPNFVRAGNQFFLRSGDSPFREISPHFISGFGRGAVSGLPTESQAFNVESLDALRELGEIGRGLPGAFRGPSLQNFISSLGQINPIARAGFDPESVLAAIRRFSPVGVTPQVTAFG